MAAACLAGCAIAALLPGDTFAAGPHGATAIGAAGPRLAVAGKALVSLSDPLASAQARARSLSEGADLAAAGQAWDEVVALLHQTDASPQALEDALFSAMSAYQLAGDGRRAAERAETYLAHVGEAAVSETAYAAHYVRATVALDAGRARQAGRSARQGLAVLERLGPSVSPSTIVMAKIAAVGSSLERNQLDTAYYLALATRISLALGRADPEHTEMEAWGQYIQRNLRPPDRLGLTQRQDASVLFRFDLPGGEPPAGTDVTTDFDWSAAGREDARPTRRSPPGYPQRAAAFGMEGVSMVSFDIDARGRPENVTVVFSIPGPLFGEAATRAVQRWRYEPARIEGAAVRREGLQTVFDFRLEQPGGSPPASQ